MFNQKIKNMKKILSILLVTMFTMSAMAFAGSVLGQPEYIKVTNKTTNQTQTILFSKFSNYQCDIDPSIFTLGFYSDDNIVVSYGGGSSMITPQIIWGVGMNNNPYFLSDTSLSKEITISQYASSLTFHCSYQSHFSTSGSVQPTIYDINIPKVHNDKRFYCSCALSTALRVTYNHYDEVRPYLKKNPYVSVVNYYSNDVVFSGYMDDNGEITFNTGGKNGIVIVTVTVDGIALPSEKTYIY